MTSIIQVETQAPDPATVRHFADLLARGGLVAFPTETVYGLGALATRPDAVGRLVEVKDRAQEKPFTRLIPSAAAALDLVREVPRQARVLMERYWPGPLTLVLPASPGSSETIGLRVPGSAFALRLLQEVGAPIVAPSANPAGAPPATTAAEVQAYFEGVIDAIADGGPAPLKEASTVVRVTGDGYEVLREGFITREMVHQLLDGKVILFVCTGNTCRSPMAEALFRKHLARNLDKPEEDLAELGYRILSAGISASYGSRASELAEIVLRERGCDLSSHISRPLTPDLVARADRIYAMTASHIEAVEAFTIDPRDLEGRLVLLGEEDVSDPIGQDIDTYRRCADEIEAAIGKVLERGT